MKNEEPWTNVDHDRMPGQLAEIETVLGKPQCGMLWLLIAVYETTPKSNGLKPSFPYNSRFCESGIQAELNWILFLFHVSSTEVTGWYSAGSWSGLEAPRWIHSHVWHFGKNSCHSFFSTVISGLLHLFCPSG